MGTIQVTETSSPEFSSSSSSCDEDLDDSDKAMEVPAVPVLTVDIQPDQQDVPRLQRKRKAPEADKENCASTSKVAQPEEGRSNGSLVQMDGTDVSPTPQVSPLSSS